jgi:hypothetical protein
MMVSARRGYGSALDAAGPAVLAAITAMLAFAGSDAAGLSGALGAEMTGPFPSVTVLNSPNCNLPGPNGSSAICTVNGTLPSAAACAGACNVSTACTGYTWHDSTMGEWAFACVFRTDGAWEPLTGATGHYSGQKLGESQVAWPIRDGFVSLPVMWFGANTSGLDSAATLALIAKHRVGGYGWQQGTGNLSPADNLGRGEVHLVAAATHLSDYLTATGANRTLTFVYRQLQVALRLFATNELAADDPANDAFWLHDPASGALCQAGQPWGTSDPFWNFSNPDALASWVANAVAEMASEAPAGVQAVFIDETDQAYCGYWDSAQGGCASQPAAVQAGLQAANNVMLTQMTAALNDAGVIPLYSSDNRLNASSAGLNTGPPCRLPLDDTLTALDGLVWARFYENWPQTFWASDGADTQAAMIQNAILTGAAGVPQLMHAPTGTCPDPGRNITRPGRLGGELEFYLATFLVAQSAGDVFSASTNWYDFSFCWHPEYDEAYGAPLGPAVRTSPYAWYRNFTACNVEVDVSTAYGAVFLL